MAELPEIIENTCGIENTEIPMEDTAIAFVTPTPDQHSYEGSLALRNPASLALAKDSKMPLEMFN